jgi:hypothetical protein
MGSDSIDDFESYYYNKVLYYNMSSIYSRKFRCFLELKEDISVWSAYKRRISRK